MIESLSSKLLELVQRDQVPEFWSIFSRFVIRESLMDCQELVYVNEFASTIRQESFST